MLRSLLSEQEIAAHGSSDTDTEEEPEYELVKYHLTHQYDMETPEEDETKHEDLTEEKADPKEDDKDTSSQNNNPNEGDKEEEKPKKNGPSVKQKILFLLQYDFAFEWIEKNIYLARSRNQEKFDLVLKIVKTSDSKLSTIPMELRILSHIGKNPSATQYLQQLKGFLMVPGGYAFFSPYGSNLRNLCKQRDFAQFPQEVKMIMHQLLLALRDLHALDVIHRDVKQSNILWENNRLTLIDYDSATWNQPGRKHYDVQGTLGFIAPEVLQFERDCIDSPQYYDSKIDVYSAGVVFGSLLFNVPENEVSEVYVRVFRQQAKALLPSDPLAVDLLLSMLQIAPNHRPSAHMLLHHSYFA